ncbi:hypothetical protein GCM10023189_20410 [Nibrella saemangeumensis]|uniref:DUF3592 domain-containing protein n=1 Tax=Nibrella saemangeumensis TaxID=1084526 RepID=A0ABP8MSF7_9BACT
MRASFSDILILLFFSVGLTFAGISLYLYQSRQSLTKNGVVTTGTVIDLIQTKRRSYTRAPAIQYTDANNQPKVYYHSVATNPPEYYVGQQVTLYYDRDHPDDIQIAGDNLMIYVMGGFGAVFLLISI